MTDSDLRKEIKKIKKNGNYVYNIIIIIALISRSGVLYYSTCVYLYNIIIYGLVEEIQVIKIMRIIYENPRTCLSFFFSFVYFEFQIVLYT